MQLKNSDAGRALFPECNGTGPKGLPNSGQRVAITLSTTARAAAGVCNRALAVAMYLILLLFRAVRRLVRSF
jgi:hypothetical protein